MGCEAVTNFADKSCLFINAWRLIAPDQHEPLPEYKFMPDRRYRFDWAFLDNLLAVEVDGGQWMLHGGRHMTDADRIKQNYAAEYGWRVLHFSPDMLTKEPEKCIKQVLRALERKEE